MAAITGTTGNDSLTGSTTVDQMYGLEGNDTLLGNAGNDVLDGGAGADVLNGGVGTDTVTYANSAAGVMVNLTSGLVLGGDAEGDTLTALEVVIGSAFNDKLESLTAGHSLQGGRATTSITSAAPASRWWKRPATVSTRCRPRLPRSASPAIPTSRS